MRHLKAMFQPRPQNKTVVAQQSAIHRCNPVRNRIVGPEKYSSHVHAEERKSIYVTHAVSGIAKTATIDCLGRMRIISNPAGGHDRISLAAYLCDAVYFQTKTYRYY